MITSKLRSNNIFSVGFLTTHNLHELTVDSFIYPTPELRTNHNGNIGHLNLSTFYLEDIKDPSFFFKKFYLKSKEQYAQEISKIFELHGIE